VLWQRGGDAGAAPDLVLLATGSEVWVALEAARTLAAGDFRVRVVSMPCWELFEAQSAEYRDGVLANGTALRVSVEAGVALGWERWTGAQGRSISVDRFGESAPGPTVLANLGFSPAAVAERARTLLEQQRSAQA
jgi:transketolase